MITKPTLRDRISTQLQYLCDATFKDEQKTCEAHADIILKDIEQEVMKCVIKEVEIDDCPYKELDKMEKAFWRDTHNSCLQHVKDNIHKLFN